MKNIYVFPLEFLQCIKRLYNCQNAGIVKENCPNVKLCVHTPKEEELEINPPVGSYLPPAASNNGAASNNNRPPLISPPPVSNGHGKPVGTFTDEEFSRPSTFSIESSTTAYTTPIPVMGEKPTNRKIFLISNFFWGFLHILRHHAAIGMQRMELRTDLDMGW